jgi:hypothetical protein
MATVIYNCKRCKVGKRIEYTAGRERSGQYSWPYRVGQNGSRVFPGKGGGDGICPQCGREMSWNYLKHVLVVEHRCDSRCAYARGPNCECSCDGANHGKGWAA